MKVPLKNENEEPVKTNELDQLLWRTFWTYWWQNQKVCFLNTATSNTQLESLNKSTYKQFLNQDGKITLGEL